MTKRRSRGEGTIYYSDKISRWVGQLTLPNGKKKTKYGKAQGEVKKWLLDQRKLIQEGNYITDENYTYENFLKRYFEDVASHTLAPRTILSYEYLTRVHILQDMGHLKLTQIRPDHLQSLYTKKLNQGLSHSTVQKIHNFIHTSLQVAYKWGLVLRNIADLAQAPVAEKKNPIILNMTEINKLLDFVKGSRWYAFYVCAASLGLREGEILALEWDDVDFNKKTVSVNKQTQYLPGKGISVKYPKTKASVRILPLPDVALNALKEHKSFSNSSIVFSTLKGTYFYPRNVLRHFQTTLGKLDLPKIPFHNLRHSCASYHLAVGTNPKIVQMLLGHSSIGVTLNIYSHLLPGVSEEATKNINKIFT